MLNLFKALSVNKKNQKLRIPSTFRVERVRTGKKKLKSARIVVTLESISKEIPNEMNN
jgi:hypothetical protein